ncbi:thioesterase [Sphingomonas sp. Leaf412]|uniref:acyl-CoA thioesterase n=1 Tax=Sphingomonas sp. Leaf412 TaxID=1736370 RepID=UPI0006F2A234|nr:acyl-CoA thioesterase [Sphingomonas sp. Leaf412]KQT31256.1 thioesterase [Sphingomonas sp. Leaf412]
MPRPAPHRLLPESYPHHQVIPTRFQDLDAMGHLNNVAFAAMFEDARVRFFRAIGRENARDGFRAVVASNTISYLHEGGYPADVAIAIGVGHIGARSYEVLAAMHQDGRAIATSETVIVMTHPVGEDLPAVFRAALERMRLRAP